MTPTLWLVLIIVIILVVWWLMSRTAETEQPDIAVHAQEEEHAVTPTRAEPIEVAPTSAPDDLTVLEGIGPKVNKVLQAAGIQTFGQLAGADLDNLKKILEENGLQFMDPGTWPQQAKLLAEGKMEEFQELASKLKGGRKVE
jgi:predicted flap endonuclease-1-like 5' DNA nuclease